MPRNTAYFAEDSVAATLRRRSISSFDTLLLRTSIDSFLQISAITKTGGRVISVLFQDIARPKQGGVIETDRHVFFLFNARARGQSTSYLNNVIIKKNKCRLYRNLYAILLLKKINPASRGD